MSSIEQVARQCKNLRLHHLSGALESLLSTAESNELSYLCFAEILMTHETNACSVKRIELNRRKASITLPKSLDEFD